MVKKWCVLAPVLKGRLMQEMIPAWVEGVLQPVEKLAAHLDGLRHKAVSVFVTRGDQLLIQQRALGKYHTPGLWANTCCTHPHWGEADIDCAEAAAAGVDAISYAGPGNPAAAALVKIAEGVGTWLNSGQR